MGMGTHIGRIAAWAWARMLAGSLQCSDAMLVYATCLTMPELGLEPTPVVMDLRLTFGFMVNLLESAQGLGAYMNFISAHALRAHGCAHAHAHACARAPARAAAHAHAHAHAHADAFPHVQHARAHP